MAKKSSTIRIRALTPECHAAVDDVLSSLADSVDRSVRRLIAARTDDVATVVDGQIEYFRHVSSGLRWARGIIRQRRVFRRGKD